MMTATTYVTRTELQVSVLGRKVLAEIAEYKSVTKAEQFKTASGTKGGGWQIKPEWYGTNHVIRCKSPYDGSFWECDHDALYDRVNASLKAKGKTGLGEPGPSQKQYGASSGLREIDLWRRVE